jgi:hypothetical protein
LWRGKAKIQEVKMKKSKLYFIAVVLFFGVFITLVWMQSPNAVFSSSAQKMITAQPTPPLNNSIRNREQMNTGKLESLLKSEAVEVSDANLLASPAEKSKTLRVRLTATNFSGEKDLSDQAASQAVSLLELKSNGGAASRMRSLELSPTQILIVSLDEQNRLVWWTTQPDPRLFRAETADDSGRLSGEEKYQETAEMLFSLPDDEKISKIRFYHPQWNGAEFNLRLVGSLDLKSE